MCLKCRGLTEEDWWARKYLKDKVPNWVVWDSMPNGKELTQKWDDMMPEDREALVAEIEAKDKYADSKRN